MPRLPAGWHFDAGAGAPGAFRPQRYVITPQRQYWRRTVTDLFAGASAVVFNPNPSQPFIPFGGPIGQRASAGPAGVGERWECHLVQVSLPALYGSPPLVTLQQSAQATGATTLPPPPFVAQAWLSVAGTNVHLLAQTTQGGNDTLDLGGQVITVGETITVLWYSTTNIGIPGLGWMALKGTRYALSAA